MSLKTSQAPLIKLFGASTPSGAAFLEAAIGRDVTVVGRQCPLGWPQEQFLPCDLTDTAAPAPTLDGVLVSFAPLWHLAPFVANLVRQHHNGGPQKRHGLKGVVACSSSSVVTKRFAANNFDRALVRRLEQAEDALEQACQNAAIPCRILRPTLIYGQAGGYGDRNLSVLINTMGRLPLLPIPSHTGLRQPIHAKQLAGVALLLADHPEAAPSRLNLGGDDTLSYGTMLRRLQAAAQALNPRDPAGRCQLLPLPMRLFHLLAAPLLPLAPKHFEAVLRIEADLAGFTPAHSLLGTEPQPFPMPPLARR
jgi:hypothetical protein